MRSKRGALTELNLQLACKRVKANWGAAWVDGLAIGQTARVIRQWRPDCRSALLPGRYRPSPVRKRMRHPDEFSSDACAKSERGGHLFAEHPNRFHMKKGGGTGPSIAL